MTEAMPFLQKYDITFLRPPTIPAGSFVLFPALSAYTVTRGNGAFWRGA